MRSERAAREYDQRDQDGFRDEVEREFERTYKNDDDVEFTPDQRVIMTDVSNNLRYRVQLTTVAGVRQLTFTPV